jgi:hypothetical protein
MMAREILARFRTYGASEPSTELVPVRPLLPVANRRDGTVRDARSVGFAKSGDWSCVPRLTLYVEVQGEAVTGWLSRKNSKALESP